MENLEINIIDKLKLIRAVYKGIVSKDIHYSATNEVMKIANKLKYNVLWDLRETTYQESVVSLYYSPREIEGLKNSYGKVKKIAGIVQQSELSFWKTGELFYTNVGINVKIFTTEKDAMNWLNDN